jgi:ABC-type Zn2+ transport system substrate-binding protein/surface adhesin
MVRKISGPKRDEVTNNQRKSQKKLHNLYSLSNIARVIKSRKVRWVGHNMNGSMKKYIQKFCQKT